MASAEEGRDKDCDDKQTGVLNRSTMMSTMADCGNKFLPQSLLEAVLSDQCAWVKHLLKEGQNPMQKTADTEDTAVHIAAKRGNVDIMSLLLAAVQGEKPAVVSKSEDDAIKNYPSIMTRNKEGDMPLHIAAKWGHEEIVRLLLSSFDNSPGKPSADPAPSSPEDIWVKASLAIVAKNSRLDTPLHIAARCGNANIMELLLGLTNAKESFESAVAKCADSSLKAHRKDGTRLAKPRQALADKQENRSAGGELDKQKEQDKRKERDELLRDLFVVKNSQNDPPVEVVAKGRRCTEDDVCWFVTCYCACQSSLLQEMQHGLMGGRDKPQHFRIAARRQKLLTQIKDSFLSVAKGFPKAASNLLQIANECGEGDAFGESGVLDPRHLRCLREAFTDIGLQGEVLEDLSLLIRKAPEAAAIVLDAVTYTPNEPDPYNDPMPCRFKPPSCELYPMTCSYQSKRAWVFADKEIWHKELEDYSKNIRWSNMWENGGDGDDEDCASKYAACAVHVVDVKGLATPDVLSGLAGVVDDCMFTKLPVHALLMYVWGELRCLFIQDMVYEGVAIIVLSRWTFDPLSSVFESSLNSSFASRLSWTLVAGQGILEATILSWTAMRHMALKDFGGFALFKWAKRNAHRIFLSMLTIGLAFASAGEHWPGMDNNISVALGTTSLWHWLTMLYKIRAFVKTGTRLLPIMKTITPMTGMLVILAFLLVGIVHVFWAWERSTADASTWKFLALLFVGDNFINDEFMTNMSTGRQWFLMILGGSAVFVFSCCTLNLFIAVLSEVYEQEQERMIVTFLRERACICSFLCLRPQLPFPKWLRVGYLSGTGRSHGWVEALGLFLSGAISIITATSVCMLLEVSNWPAAVLLAFWAVLQQALMHHDLTSTWDDKYLWYCTDTSTAEDLFSLGHRPEDQMFPQSRAWKLKGYITEVLNRLEHQDNVINRVDVEMKQVQELKGKIDEMEKHIKEVAGLLSLTGSTKQSEKGKHKEQGAGGADGAVGS